MTFLGCKEVPGLRTVDHTSQVVLLGSATGAEGA